MKDLLKVALVIALAFASTFVVMRLTGILTEERVRAFLAEAHTIHPGWFVALVVALLLLDLLVAIPTMTTILLAGYFLGAWLGGAAAVLGLLAMGSTGYALGRRFGRPVLSRLFASDARLAEVERAFARNDLLVLFACQALPILPELSCCLAGIARTPLPRFFFGYAVGVVPFAFVVAWAGSASTLADPKPAILTVIGVSVGLLTVWTLLAKQR
jgi:uncharacterized membrane protein YdjX (TVP38/TMEM64 family)